ncbi:MAG: MFS transporter, partial [Bacillus amyloliquefaciens]
TKVISSSENGTTIAAAVSVSAFNLANALGAWIGGLILGGTGSYSWLFAGGALMTALGLVLSTFAHLSEKKDVYEYQVHKG